MVLQAGRPHAQSREKASTRLDATLKVFKVFVALLSCCQNAMVSLVSWSSSPSMTGGKDDWQSSHRNLVFGPL